jgi:alkylhydroperoxidase/carboxymuconolactone decarboxylase family protein YurZ
VDAEQRILELEAQARPYDEWPKAMNEMTCFGRYGACKHIEKCKWGAPQE